MPTQLPAWLDFDGLSWDTQYLTPAQLAAAGWLALIYDPEGAPLGYASPVEESRDGSKVAVAYALGTLAERAAECLRRAQTVAHSARATERDRRQTKTFPHAGHRYACDRDSILRIGRAATAADRAIAAGHPEMWSAGAGWRDADGVPRIATATDMLALDGSLIALGLGCDLASQAIAADIEAATTTADIEAIVAAIPTDPRWPA